MPVSLKFKHFTFRLLCFICLCAFFRVHAENNALSTAQFYQQYLSIFAQNKLSDHEKITRGQTLLFNINEQKHPKIAALTYLQLMNLSAKRSDNNAFRQSQSKLQNITLDHKNQKVVNFLVQIYQVSLNSNEGQFILAISQGKALKARIKDFEIKEKEEYRFIDNHIYLTKYDEAMLNNTLGISFFRTSDYEAAQQHFIYSIDIYEKQNALMGRLMVLNNLSMISWAQQNYQQAIEMIKKAIAISQEIPDEVSYIRGLTNLGIYYAEAEQYDNALASYNKVLQHPEIDQHPKIQIQCLIAKAESFQKIGQYDESEKIIQNALLIGTKTNDKVSLSTSKVALADLLTQQGKYDQALNFYLNAMHHFEELQMKDHEVKVLLQISQLYKKQGQFADALNYLELYNERSIEILNNAQKSSITVLHEKYQAQSRERKIQLLEQDNQLNTIEIIQAANQKRFILFSSICIIIMMLLLFSRHFKHKESVRLKKYNDEIKASEKELLLLSHAFSSTSDAVWITNEHFEIEAVNNAYVQQTHKTKLEVLGKKVTFAQVKGQDENLANRIMLQAKLAETWHGEIFDSRSDDEIYPLELDVEVIKNKHNEIIHYLGVFRDITERKKSQEQLAKLATHDDLTGLPNRALLDQLIQQSCLNAKHSKKSPTLLLLDVNGFKKINDSFGHQLGDKIICEISERLKTKLYAKDVVARINGAEFCILAELNDPQRSAARVAQKILSIFEQPFNQGQNSLTLTASMGITLYPDDSDNAQDLLRKAAIAMLDVKASDSHHYRFFEEHMNNEVTAQLEQEQSILNAIVNQQFEFYYQPLVNTQTGNISGAEALIRWTLPDGTIISPEQFIPLAEQAGFIDQIDRITINKVFEQVAKWQSEKRVVGAISINLSAKIFSQHHALLTMLKAKLSQYRIDAKHIKIEITEGMLLQDIDQAIDTMNGIKSLGFQLALDDFGTGFSSLNYLKKFPIDILKIDRSFIREMHECAIDQSIVHSIISLAHTLNLTVVGEGVELAEHLDELKKMKCEEYQGYLYSKPVPITEFEALLSLPKK
ncbi:EAL domain-containing protein [Colwelliaceae bacterium 6441]